MDREVLDRGPLAVAILGRGEHHALLIDDDERDDLFLGLRLLHTFRRRRCFRQPNATDAGSRATHRAHVVLIEANRHLPLLEHRMICLVPSVISTPTSRSPCSSSMAMMPAWRGRENASSDVFFTVPAAVTMNTNLLVFEFVDRQHSVDALAFLQRQQIHNWLSARAAARLRQLIHLQPIQLAGAGEAQQRVVSIGDEQLVDEILVLHRSGGLAATATTLRLIVR